MAPKLVEAGRSPNIEILTNARLEALEGKPGNFIAKVYQEPRYIDEDKCTACGTCTMYCPMPVVDLYNERLNVTRAPHIDYAQAIPSCFYIDAKACLRVNYEVCNLCAQTCIAGAIDFTQKPKKLELEVGAVILSPGFGRVSQEVLERFGYGRYPDVLTSMEFERLTCASGPSEGHIIRLSDHKPPKKIAFLQCIGSRDETCGNGYCSSVCCMYAFKEASVAKEHEPDLDIALFFMDIRTQGKGFDLSREQATQKYGFRIIRARVPKVDQVEGKLLLTWTEEDGSAKSEFFDMVVLSIGLESPSDAKEIAEIAGIELNNFDFCKTAIASPLNTNKDGIFVAGAFQGPKDIPESVTQASGVAALASEILGESRKTKTITITYPEENQELLKLPPRIGVFVCHCGVNIAGVIDVKKVAEYAATLPDVVLSETTLYSCSQDALRTIAEKIKENQLNRVVIAACSPRTHEPLFKETLRSIGVNAAFIEMANIRDQCAWVHSKEPEAATEKAKDLVRMAVAKARLLEPLYETQVDVTPRALVIGGGISGMSAAISIAEQGYECVLIEKTDSLGGIANKLSFTLTGEDPKEIVKDLVNKVKKHPKITLYTNATLKSLSGYIGNFISIIDHAGEEIQVEHGVTIIATGARPYKPKGYLYGESNRVITQLELEQRLKKGKSSLKNVNTVVMIQCVGSRGEDQNYCSKVCCMQAVKNALKLKELKPSVRIYVFYRDMRTYGFSEAFYREAREKGVIFLRYEPDKKPEVVKSGRGIKVKAFDRISQMDIEIPASLVVLSTGIAPAEDNENISKIIKTPITQDGFFLEAHAKLRPIEVAVDGVFICGLSHGPKGIDECIAQAKAAASKAVIPLSKGKVSVEPIVSRIDKDKCIGCGICVSLCPYNAIQMVKVGKRRKAETISASCKGCGICASHCPVLAISMGGFTDEQIFSQIHAFAASYLESEAKANNTEEQKEEGNLEDKE